MRTGASYEISADGEIVLHAGKRGIEGAILDFAKEMGEKDPEMYKKLVESLAKYSTDGSAPADTKALGDTVHRFIVDYAKEHNFKPEQLDKILAADVRLKDLLTIDDEKLKLIEKAAAVTEATEPTGGISPDLPEALDATKEKAGEVDALVQKVSGSAETVTDKSTELLKQAELAAAEAADSLEEVKQQSELLRERMQPIKLPPDVGSGGGADKIPQAEAPSPPPSPARGEGVVNEETPDAEETPKTEAPEVKSSELEIYVSDSFGLHAEEFKAVEDKSIGEFMKMFDTGASRFKALYGLLAERLKEIFAENQESQLVDPEVLKQVSIREIVQDLAINK